MGTTALAIGSLLIAAAGTAYGVISNETNRMDAGDMDTDPMPLPEDEKDPVSKTVRDEEMRKLKTRRYLSGTVLTSPLGDTSGSGGKTLLGG